MRFFKRARQTLPAGLAFGLLITLLGNRASAQRLPIKGALAASGVGGCAAFPAPPLPTSTSPNADVESRRLIDEAQDAALAGDHTAARDAFARAARLTPNNPRIAYYLGREQESLSESTGAVREYCRYLALSRNAPDADEVRGRIVRLTPATELARVDEAKAAFNSGVSLLRRKQYEAADSVFAGVVRQVPAAPEPYFNRALSRAARGNRAMAMQDFEKYLELLPQATDRAVVRGAMARLPDGVYSPSSALSSGLLVPGLGQMTTGRPVRGIFTLALVGASIGWGLQVRHWESPQQFTDPFGNPYIDTIPRSARSNAATGLAIAGVIWVGSALEAMGHARRSRARAESIIALPGNVAGGAGMALEALPHGRLGVGVSLPFGRHRDVREVPGVVGDGNRSREPTVGGAPDASHAPNANRAPNE